jgi:nucleoside-diphosphate-sugar epimerase
MKILLIGATGQIGYALTRALSETDHQLSVLVRDGRKLPFPAGVRVIERSTFDPDAFRAALAGVEHVIYSVGLPEQFQFDTSIFQRVNYGLFKTFLEVLRETPVRELTYISTYEVFQAIDGVIRVSHPLADESGLTPYFRAMLHAYRLALEFAAEHGIALTTIHPAGVYGGLNTGDGITTYLENLRAGRVWRAPLIVEGRFPVVHAASLADAIIRSLGHQGAYIVSDQMTTLRDMALVLKEQANCYVPPGAPPWLVKPLAGLMEVAARALRVRPIVARVQIEFIAHGWDPRPDETAQELGWRPMPLEAGIRRYLGETGGG